MTGSMAHNPPCNSILLYSRESLPETTTRSNSQWARVCPTFARCGRRRRRIRMSIYPVGKRGRQSASSSRDRCREQTVTRVRRSVEWHAPQAFDAGDRIVGDVQVLQTGDLRNLVRYGVQSAADHQQALQGEAARQHIRCGLQYVAREIQLRQVDQELCRQATSVDVCPTRYLSARSEEGSSLRPQSEMSRDSRRQSFLKGKTTLVGRRSSNLFLMHAAVKESADVDDGLTLTGPGV